MIDRHLSDGLSGDDTIPLPGQQVIAKGLQILLTVKKAVHKSCETFLCDEDRPSHALSLHIDGTSENAAYHLVDHAVVRTALKVPLLKTLREQQASNEVAHRDVATAQLRFQGWIAIGLHRMKEDLPVGLLNELVEIASNVCISASNGSGQRRAGGVLIAGQIGDPAVLRAEGVGTEGDHHSRLSRNTCQYPPLNGI